MKIAEYRTLVDQHLYSPLKALGFQMQGDHLYLNKNSGCFAILRIMDKWSNITQQVRYLAVVRHEFLPDLEAMQINGFVDHPALYPFKVNPLKLSGLKTGFFKKSIKYQYQSCNLGHYDTVNIAYGETDPTNVLKAIASEVASAGLEWFDYLSPNEAAHQIRNHGNNEYIEKIWVKAYATNSV